MLNRRRIKKKVKKYHWLIILIVTTITSMWIYGMVKVYYPDPLYIGFGQYLDLGTGIIIFSLILSGFVVGIFFNQKKKR
ncbi:hypothetical protein LCGC14_1817810 [marine sediment metagenome]|uniref:Uncharacterized protein n=1 Tax=marine sediment metagenome TaxID=412755 RepID=A0A0F9GJU6_9ZZZZ